MAAIPRTFPFFSNEGEIGTMIAVCVAGIAVNAVIIYMCGWAVEGRFQIQETAVGHFSQQRSRAESNVNLDF